HDKDRDFDDLYTGQVYREAEPGALKKYEGGLLDDIKAAFLGFGGAAFDALRRLRFAGKLDDRVLHRIKEVRDLGLYYDENRKIRDREKKLRPVRQVIMDELKNALLPLEGQQIMVIAHSMGSIIAYDVLRDIGQEKPAFGLAHFVTIGSPLGLEPVKDKIHETYKKRGHRRTPTIVTKRWANYADRDDPIAIDKHLSDDYGPNDRGIHVEDDLVLNDYVNPSGDRNAHKSYGYLRTPELSEHIRDFIQP
ncbi:MAG: hypothetical protein IIC26_06405, partial [Chloroflexi bacterium]|nr:hypothetical protein [Chloroflexota bacterium]